MKQTFYVWPAHLEEFLRYSKRRKKRDTFLMFFNTQEQPLQIPVTLTWKAPAKKAKGK